MEEREVQLQSVPQKSSLPQSLNQSTVSRHIRTELQQQKLPKKEKISKLTLKNMLKFLFTIAVVIGVVAYLWQKPQTNVSGSATRNYKEGAIELNQTTGKKYAWIRQKLDHFSPTDERTFYQRMFINNEGGSNFKGIQPVFLYLNGFLPVNQLQGSALFLKQIRDRKGISLALQFRYFGESQPFPQGDSYSLENLKYLTLQQIVEDVAFAIQRIVDNRFFGITQRHPWVINAALYAGSIAAMVRAKYPKLSVGAIASSPRIPVPLAPLISERIYEKVVSGGKKCNILIAKILQDLEEQLSDDRREALIYSIGQGVELTPEEILYFFQQRLNKFSKEGYVFTCYKVPQTEFIKDMKTIFLTQQALEYDPLSLSQRAMASVDDWRYFQVVRTYRAQWYLRCTQSGLFQIYTKKSFVSPKINETFFRQRCKYIFGAALWPNPQPFMDMYKPYLSTATNLLIVHGYYDIHLPYGLNTSSPRTETIIQKCLQCEQRFDYFQNIRKNPPIEEAFDKEKDYLDRWLRK